MARTNDLSGGADAAVQHELTDGGPATPDDRRVRPTRVPKLGIWAWCFVGVVVAMIIVSIALGAVSEIVLADDVRGRAGHRLQAAGRGPRTPRVEADPGGRAHRPRPLALMARRRRRHGPRRHRPGRPDRLP